MEFSTKQKLVSLLQLAYSGELAAAYAYRGHWKSLKNTSERMQIQKIEQDEWEHRRDVGEMLQQLDAAPSRWREFKMRIIGRVIGLSCHVIGWFLPMYLAGRLESRNVLEYRHAAAYARE